MGPAGENGNNYTSAIPAYSKLYAFFVDQLKDIYWAEKHLTKALPKMQKAVTTAELRQAFKDHLKQTAEHIERLEQVFEIAGKKVKVKKCEAMQGLAKEAASIIGDTEKNTMTRDAALIIAAQKIEHYEIATYGGLVQLAITLGLEKAASILEKTLQEEKDTDASLSEIAENKINWEAEEEINNEYRK